MGQVPSGTLTMLFTDIEGSTVPLSRLGDRYVDALDDQRSILRETRRRAGGHKMGTEGDSFFVVFASAREAAGATLQGRSSVWRPRVAGCRTGPGPYGPAYQ